MRWPGALEDPGIRRISEGTPGDPRFKRSEEAGDIVDRVLWEHGFLGSGTKEIL
jgi:hypothetical protein